MPNQFKPERPLFGRSMIFPEGEKEKTATEGESTPSILSEEKAQAFLEKQTESTAPQEVTDLQKSEEEAEPDNFYTEERAAIVREFHFGKPKAADEDTIFTKNVNSSDKNANKEQKKKKHKQENSLASGKKKPSHPFWRRIWNLLFSDTSFRREDCLIPKSSAGVDRIFLLVFVLLLSIGSVMVFSSSYAYAEARYDDSSYFVRRQLIFAALGVAVMLVASMMTVKFYHAISRFAFLVTVFLLIAVLLFGTNLNGAQRWIGIGPITVQPTEIAKMTMVMLLAWYYAEYEHKLKEKRSFWHHLSYNTILPGAIIATVCGLVMLQKHLSGIIILGAIGIIVMFVSGTDVRHLGTLMGVAVAGVTCIALFTDYTKRRIDIWLDPEAMALDGGWQTLQGLNAIGTGGLLGLGIGDSRMKYSYVSEPANDFIFTIACEELGFVGAFIILALFAVFIWRGYVIAMRNPDTYARILTFGIVTKVAVQLVLNIAVITNTIPNTGIPLPFFSYGGTSLIIQLLEMGIVLSASRTSQLKYR